MNKKFFKLQISNIAWLIVTAMFFILDRYLKYLITNIQPSQPQKIINNLLTFNFVPNDRIAFSLPISGLWLNFAIITIIITILIYLFSNLKSLAKIEIIAIFGLILGATSNLLDRLKYGYVIDYLDLRWFTIFNLADVLISLNIFILIFYLLKIKKPPLTY